MLLLGVWHRHDSTPLAFIYWLAIAAVFVLLTVHWVRRGPRDAVVLDRFIAEIEQRAP